jgi:hypothetical protein
MARRFEAKPMTDAVSAWITRLRMAWVRSLNALRTGVLGTSELRNGKRVDTTLETIAERKKDLAELDAAIVQHEADQAKP